MNVFKKPKPKNAKHRIGEIIQVDNSKTYFSALPKTIIEGKIIMFCIIPNGELGYMVDFEGFGKIPLLVYEDEIIVEKVQFT